MKVRQRRQSQPNHLERHLAFDTVYGVWRAILQILLLRVHSLLAYYQGPYSKLLLYTQYSTSGLWRHINFGLL